VNKEQFYKRVKKLGFEDEVLRSVYVNEGVGGEGYFLNEMPDDTWTVSVTERSKEKQKDHFENESQAFTYMFGRLMESWVISGYVIPNPVWNKPT
jgi:hypothetical protein